MKALQALLDSLYEEQEAVQLQLDEQLDDDDTWKDYLWGKKAGLTRAINIVTHHMALKKARAS